jgi:hypothetical protein
MTRNHVGWNKKLKLSMELSDSWGIHVAYYILKKNNLKIFVENEKKIIFPNRFDILMLKIIFKK